MADEHNNEEVELDPIVFELEDENGVTHFASRNTRVVTAEAPLSEMFGYSTALRGMSQGRASYAMEPLAYRPVPPNIAKEVLEAK